MWMQSMPMMNTIRRVISRAKVKKVHPKPYATSSSGYPNKVIENQYNEKLTAKSTNLNAPQFTWEFCFLSRRRWPCFIYYLNYYFKCFNQARVYGHSLFAVCFVFSSKIFIRLSTSSIFDWGTFSFNFLNASTSGAKLVFSIFWSW